MKTGVLSFVEYAMTVLRNYFRDRFVTFLTYLNVILLGNYYSNSSTGTAQSG